MAFTIWNFAELRPIVKDQERSTLLKSVLESSCSHVYRDSIKIPLLVSLNARVYSPHKRIRRQEPYRSRRQAVHCASQRGVAEEQQTAYESLDVQPRGVIPRRIDKNPKS